MASIVKKTKKDSKLLKLIIMNFNKQLEAREYATFVRTHRKKAII